MNGDDSTMKQTLPHLPYKKLYGKSSVCIDKAYREHGYGQWRRSNAFGEARKAFGQGIQTITQETTNGPRNAKEGPGR